MSTTRFEKCCSGCAGHRRSHVDRTRRRADVNPRTVSRSRPQANCTHRLILCANHYVEYIARTTEQRRYLHVKIMRETSRHHGAGGGCRAVFAATAHSQLAVTRFGATGISIMAEQGKPKHIGHFRASAAEVQCIMFARLELSRNTIYDYV